MRRYRQKQLLELMGTIREANHVIKNFLADKNYEAAIQLLFECQQGAVEVGQTIEQLEGEGTKAVSYLEDYCDLLYQAGVSLENNKESGKICNQLYEQAGKIIKSIQADIKTDRLEVIFLPYKACMWDSMESIWMAAKEDPQCDSFVIPIPYYDLEPGQVFGQMHYEGHCYPEYVPITDWKKYNIEIRHPDIIFVHNPYDNINLTTSVAPGFYSKQLKNYTDMLVYIPYFVCIHDLPEYFCEHPGVIFADRVMVQSEKIRDACIGESKKLEKGNSAATPEDKFVALGSPKFDKVLNTKREDCKIPEEWRKLIEKPDGSRKKVILYNTSVSGLLNGNEAALAKLRHVLETFKGREDSVLLWRPHPLNVSVCASMLPRLLDEYLRIVTAYIEGGWGIYDETADMNRAIALSDAYYGDWSSLVILYQCTGKPLMIQNIEVDEKNTKAYTLAFTSLYSDDKYIWFTALNFNALFRMDKKDWKTEYLGSFPNEKWNGWNLYRSIAAYGSKLFFAPGSADEIAIYDSENGNFKKIKFAEPEIQSNVRSRNDVKFCCAVQYKNWIIFIGSSYPAFLRYDTISGQLDYFSDWVEPLNKLVTAPEDVYFRQEACVSSSCFTIAACNANAVVVFDMEHCVSKVYEAGSKKQRYADICFDGKGYWLLPRNNGPVVRWNPETKEYKEYNNYPDGFKGEDRGFWRIDYADGFIWLFPYKANMALKMNITDESIVIAEEFQAECEQIKSATELLAENYILSGVAGDVLYAHTGKSNKFIEYNFKTGAYREAHVRISEEDKKATAAVRSYIFNKDVSECNSVNDCNFYEDAYTTLEDFIHYVNAGEALTEAKALSARQEEICRNTIQNSDGTAGKAIFEYCKQAVR